MPAGFKEKSQKEFPEGLREEVSEVREFSVIGEAGVMENSRDFMVSGCSTQGPLGDFMSFMCFSEFRR